MNAFRCLLEEEVEGLAILKSASGQRVVYSNGNTQSFDSLSIRQVTDAGRTQG